MIKTTTTKNIWITLFSLLLLNSADCRGQVSNQEKEIWSKKNHIHLWSQQSALTNRSPRPLHKLRPSSVQTTESHSLIPNLTSYSKTKIHDSTSETMNRTLKSYVPDRHLKPLEPNGTWTCLNIVSPVADTTVQQIRVGGDRVLVLTSVSQRGCGLIMTIYHCLIDKTSRISLMSTWKQTWSNAS